MENKCARGIVAEKSLEKRRPPVLRFILICLTPKALSLAGTLHRGLLLALRRGLESQIPANPGKPFDQTLSLALDRVQATLDHMEA